MCAMLLHSQLSPLADDPDFDPCDNKTNGFQARSTETADEDGLVSARVYVPYPTEGMWLLALTVQCFEFDSGNERCVTVCERTRCMLCVFSVVFVLSKLLHWPLEIF